MGAVVARAEIMNWTPGSHANTFGGNPVACAAANVTLQLLENGLMENAQERGLQLQAGLAQLSSTYNWISPPRGKGLMVAIDILDEQGNLDATRRDRLLQYLFYQGLILLGCGRASIRFCPPLVITSEQIAIALNILTKVLKLSHK